MSSIPHRRCARSAWRSCRTHHESHAPPTAHAAPVRTRPRRACYLSAGSGHGRIRVTAVLRNGFQPLPHLLRFRPSQLHHDLALAQEYEIWPQLDPKRSSQRPPLAVLHFDMTDIGERAEQCFEGPLERLTVGAPARAKLKQDRPGQTIDLLAGRFRFVIVVVERHACILRLLRNAAVETLSLYRASPGRKTRDSNYSSHPDGGSQSGIKMLSRPPWPM